MIDNILINELYKNLNNQLENLIIESLKLHGFEFTIKQELELFAKENITRTDNIEFKEHIYYVNKTPFFLHRYECIYEPITQYNNEINMSANLGSYCFL